jgi:type IX secretion system PorP/SprF family membrane protein
MKNIITALLLLACFTKATAQQDAQFSQYMFNGIYINPAYAGYKEQLNMHAFYRNQWSGIEGAPQTMSVAIDAIANNGNVGLALQLSSDRIGAQKSQSVYANYAYRLPISSDGSSRLAFGLGLGVVQNGIDGSMLNANDLEPNQPLGMQSSMVPDARVGAFYADDRFYAGISADNLVSQYISTDTYDFIPKPKPHYYLTAGMLLPINESVQLKPSFLLKDDRGGQTSFDVSAFAIFAEKIWVGGSYRMGVKLYDKSYLQKSLSNLNSAVAAVQLFPSDNLRIGYAHDFTLGALRGYSGSTHEISFSYFFNLRSVRMGTPRYF